jgi:predicted nucleotidyltransferase component of viral defense system
MLYWNTVNDLLKESLIKLMRAEGLRDFRLVGGTALSLYLGHRESVDIDLFTDADYGSIDFDAIEAYLQKNFSYVNEDFGRNPVAGKSYLIGTNIDTVVKLDIYYSSEPFLQDFIEEDGVRLASKEDIIAMKIDVVQRIARKKDFWDLHELLAKYTISDMIALHQKRCEWTHDQAIIQKNFTDFTNADDDFDPICLKNKEWVFIKEDITDAAKF